MTRYFFDVHDGVDRKDREGTNCRDLRHARAEAVRFAAELLVDSAETFGDDHELRIIVRDETGLAQFSLLLVATSAPTDHTVGRSRGS